MRPRPLLGVCYCVQRIARDLGLEDLSIRVEVTDDMKRRVERRKSSIQSYQNEIVVIDSALEFRNSALQGESCPQGQ